MAKQSSELVRAKRMVGLLGLAIAVQFFWWNEKCPQVLAGGGYGGGDKDKKDS